MQNIHPLLHDVVHGHEPATSSIVEVVDQVTREEDHEASLVAAYRGYDAYDRSDYGYAVGDGYVDRDAPAMIVSAAPVGGAGAMWPST